jgi:hypothetical protein
MTDTGRKLMLSAAAVVAALVFTTGSGLPTASGIAAAATLGPHAGLNTDSSAVTLAKKAGPVLKCCGAGGGKLPKGPDDFAPGGGGGGGGKGGKGGGHHHHHWGPAIGGGIILGLGYCAIQSERCEDTYGEDTRPYWRCMRRAGC